MQLLYLLKRTIHAYVIVTGFQIKRDNDSDASRSNSPALTGLTKIEVNNTFS